MHVLTKVFIVLVSLLSVLLVPLVVVYSHNEDSFKAKYEQADIQAKAANSALQTAQALNGAEVEQLNAKISGLDRDKAELERDLTDAQVQVRELEAKLVAAESLKTEINARLATLASSTKAAQDITSSLLNETRDLRGDGVRLREQNTDLEQALNEVTSQLEVATAARRALKEELERLKEEHGQAIAKIADYVAMYGDIQAVAASSMGGIAPDINLTAPILAVRRTAQGTYAEIDAGSTDGVKEGWIMTIAHGGRFIGNLRIEKVDLNKSTGIVMLEDESRAGLVQVGYQAIANAGID